MDFSARERTALRAMIELARRYGEGPVPLSVVADAQGLPQPYLERIAGALRRSGLLSSVRGAYGGYMLARGPEAITVGDVFRAVDEPFGSIDCIGTSSSGCSREAHCAAHIVWRRIAARLRDTLDSTSLADIQADGQTCS